MADDDCKKLECPPGAPVWMCTFADLMSLLLCFFVLLLSFSTMDVVKYKRAVGSLKDAFGIQYRENVAGTPHGQLMVSTDFLSTPLAVKVQSEINEVVAEEVDAGLIDVELNQDGILLRVKDRLGYEFGKASLNPKFTKILDKIGSIIQKTGSTVIVSGHTDNVPLRKGGAFSSNWTLSTARSATVVEYWAQNNHISAKLMSAMGYADGQPVASNDTAVGRSSNRRVEFKIKVNQQARSFQGLKELLMPTPKPVLEN